ncbi:MAG: hypothetical protein JWQ66_4180, partial [Mucilaginibacter sp.]|nr:hypothetical protein [Mucilaginibacter sp.]
MKPIIQKSLLILVGLALSQQVLSQAPNIAYTSSTNLTSGTLFSISPTNTGGAVPATVYGQVSTIAGNIYGGYANGTGTAAAFNLPQLIVGDPAGNLYVADSYNNAIRKITPAGVVSTYAGSSVKGNAGGYADGPAASALFNGPSGVAIDASGNLFVADENNNAIREITPAGVVSTFASLSGPSSVSFDSSGNLYALTQSSSSNEVVKISATGIVTVVAGNTGTGYVNATGTSARFNLPNDLHLDASGNIYVADLYNNAIRKVSPGGVVTTFAGSSTPGNTAGYANGTGTAALFNNPNALAIGNGGIIYVADLGNRDIRKITPDGAVTLVAGSPTQAQGYSDGTGTNALFNQPAGLYIDASGTGYIVDMANYDVRKILLTGYTISGTLPAGLSFDPATGTISGTPTGTITTRTDTITAYNASGYATTTVTFSPAVVIPAPNIKYTTSVNNLTAGTPFSISPTNTGGAVPATVYGQVTTIAGSMFGSPGYVNATGTAARFNTPKRLVIDASGNFYVGDAGNNAIRKITPAGVVTTFAGSLTGASGFTNATGTAALFNAPGGMAIDAAGNFYVSDYNNNAIRKITPAGVVTTFYSGASTFGPAGLCFDSSGNLIVVAQTLRQILKISPAGVATIIAGSNYGYANGTGTAALFENPTDVKIDASGNMYIADYLNNAIRKITPAGVVTTYAGSDVSGNTGGFLDGTGTAAKFNSPTGLAMTPGGVIYVAELANHDIRRIMPDGTVKQIAGSPAQAS